MNELIEELAEQADDYAYKKYAKKSSGHEREYFFRQKFAKLIVQECTSVVKDAVDHREPASTYVGKIKEHFGVE